MDTKIETERLIRDAHVEATPASVTVSVRYVKRTRWARRFGIVLGLVAGFGPLAARSNGENLVIPRMIAGYLIGLLVSEIFAPRVERATVRRASLRSRTAYDLLPRLARWAPWLTLLPVLATPLLLLGWHPRGRSHARLPHHGGSCSAVATWPSAIYLFTAVALAVAALALTELTLHRLAVRQQPAEDATMRSLDHAMRAHSARSAVAASAALGLILLQQVNEAVLAGTHSGICTHFARDFNWDVYSWSGAWSPWLSNLQFTLLVLAVSTYFVVRRARVPTLDDGVASA